MKSKSQKENQPHDVKKPRCPKCDSPVFGDKDKLCNECEGEKNK